VNHTKRLAEALFALRRSCTVLERQTFKLFVKRYFVERRVGLSIRSLDQLVEISQQESIASHLRTIIFETRTRVPATDLAQYERRVQLVIEPRLRAAFSHLKHINSVIIDKIDDEKDHRPKVQIYTSTRSLRRSHRVSYFTIALFRAMETCGVTLSSFSVPRIEGFNFGLYSWGLIGRTSVPTPWKMISFSTLQHLSLNVLPTNVFGPSSLGWSHTKEGAALAICINSAQSLVSLSLSFHGLTHKYKKMTSEEENQEFYSGLFQNLEVSTILSLSLRLWHPRTDDFVNFLKRHPRITQLELTGMSIRGDAAEMGTENWIHVLGYLLTAKSLVEFSWDHLKTSSVHHSYVCDVVQCQGPYLNQTKYVRAGKVTEDRQVVEAALSRMITILT
jgi:hypothetical protein